MNCLGVCYDVASDQKSKNQYSENLAAVGGIVAGSATNLVEMGTGYVVGRALAIPIKSVIQMYAV
jgi:anaerobic glycerol-3-phosphate dehydrogenase